MIRTFHAKIDPVVLFGGMLPCTVMAIYFFWIKLVLPAAVFMVIMVVLVERMIHSSYTLTDDGRLLVYKGRFSRSATYALDEIKKIELYRPSFFFLFKRRDVVLLTLNSGRQIIVTPFPAAEFCHVLLKRREEYIDKQKSC